MIYFGFLILTAVLLYYAKFQILIIAALVGFFAGWFWLCQRFPRTMIVLTGFLRGLLSRR